MERNRFAGESAGPGGRSVGVKEVAARAGVSVGTVSNVLNGRRSVAPEYVERVMRAIGELGFVPNDAARTLRAGSSRVIGFLISEEDNPFFTDIVRGAEGEAEKSGGIILIGHTRGDPKRESYYLEAFAEQRARGVIIQPYGDVAADLTLLRSRNTPTVVLEPDRSTGSGSSISVDNTEGGRLAAKHLVEIGRNRLAFVGGPPDFPVIERRVEGAREGAGSATLEVIGTADTTIEHGRAVGEEIAARAPAGRPDGIFAGNDLVALGLLNAFTRAGIRVPEDIAIVGYDDIALARSAHVPLSSVRQPREEMGAAAVRIIEEERLEGTEERHLRLYPELVIRSSSVGA